MFGDDPDPMVTKVRFGFGIASDAHIRGVDALCREVQMAGQQKNSWSRTGQQRQQGEAGTTNGCEF